TKILRHPRNSLGICETFLVIKPLNNLAQISRHLPVSGREADAHRRLSPRIRCKGFEVAAVEDLRQCFLGGTIQFELDGINIAIGLQEHIAAASAAVQLGAYIHPELLESEQHNDVEDGLGIGPPV